MGEIEENFSTNTPQKDRARLKLRLKKILSVNPNYKLTQHWKNQLSSKYFTLDKRAMNRILRKRSRKRSKTYNGLNSS